MAIIDAAFGFLLGVFLLVMIAHLLSPWLFEMFAGIQKDWHEFRQRQP